MNKREFERVHHLTNDLQSLGFTLNEIAALRRISKTLRRWYELDCSGLIERGDDGDGPPYMVVIPYATKTAILTRIPDRENGAKKRLAAIIKRVNVQRDGKVEPLSCYIQTDPRGCALYILRPSDVPDGESAASYYTRGVAVY
jgi:hypothetical protein